jgi:CRP/FNR family transcriptional regulator, cyclic AMP receptor protein
MNSQSIKKYLLTHSFFSGLNDGTLDFLCQCSSSHEIKKGLILFQQGANADKFYVIHNGRISIQMPAIMGPNLLIQTLENDHILGWSWMIPPYKWSFQAVAEKDTELLMFNGSALLAHCEQDPKFGYDLLKKFAGLMSTRLDVARQKMMDEWNPPGFA